MGTSRSEARTQNYRKFQSNTFPTTYAGLPLLESEETFLIKNQPNRGGRQTYPAICPTVFALALASACNALL